MKYETRFNIGDSVYQIRRYSRQKRIPCQACSGRGKVKLDGNVFSCNSCNGSGGNIVWLPTEWNTDGSSGEIGNIRICAYGEKWTENGSPEIKIEYMLDITGVGSGTLYHEDELFVTKEEAERACIEKNSIEKVE